MAQTSSPSNPPTGPQNGPPKQDGMAILLLLIMVGASVWMVAQGVLIFEKSQWNDGGLLGMGLLGLTFTAGVYVLLTGLARGGSAAAGDHSLDKLKDALLLSDTAKRIIYRERDRQALRRAIREDIDKRDYEAALVLVGHLAQVYGYRLEAEQFRGEIEAARDAEQQRRIDEAIRGLDNMIARHDFDLALKEAAKLERVYEENERVANLRKHVREARDRYKQELERKFLEASGRDDIEVAMELLKELDTYLSGPEAAPFLETARGVIGKKRQNLGVQFKLAVHDKDWTDAVRVGEQIIREFPNSKMGEEVRQRMDLLRQRAAEQNAARPREMV